jgi:hypothetical protein
MSSMVMVLAVQSSFKHTWKDRSLCGGHIRFFNAPEKVVYIHEHAHTHIVCTYYVCNMYEEEFLGRAKKI